VDSKVRWSLVVLGSLIGAVVIGYIALKVAPDWFASEISCHPGDKNFNECLDAVQDRADDRRG
jgi:hypothetical protein